jgi:phage terminase large subunit-like protein
LAKTTKKTPGPNSKRDHCKIARQYAVDVVSGKRTACKWVKAACQRQLDDLDRWQKDGPYKWSPSKAAEVCRFIELLPHVKGPLSDKTIDLEPWQCFILTTIFGWLKRDTGTRRYRKAYIEVPRGNAKSTLSSGVGLYMGFAEGEGGARVYSAATTMKQAREVFGDAQAMARKSEGFRRRFGVDVSAHNIHQLGSNSFFEAVSSEEHTLDGLNIHLAIVDELHAHRTRGVHDVLETGAGKRPQSLLWEITTAGFNRSGICYEVRTYVTQILNSVLKRHDELGHAALGSSVDEETYFGIIYTVDDEDDPFSLEALQKANPNWGVSVETDSVLATQRKAMQMASAANNFKTKHLDLWVNADTAWMDMRAWDKCADHSIAVEQFRGRPCFLFLDLASVSDLACAGMWFPPHGDDEKHTVFVQSYLSERAVEESSNSQYQGWEQQGYIIQTPGNVTDYGRIKDDVLRICSEYDVLKIGLDPFQAVQFTQLLKEAGIPDEKILNYGATVGNFSEPMKDIESKVLAGKLRHDGNPVLAWSMSNVVAHLDVKDNIFPRKERPENKIDPSVALIGCNGLRMREPQAEPSVYANPETAVM